MKSSELAFTYIDDVVEVISTVHAAYPTSSPSEPIEECTDVPFRILNVGGSKTVRIDELIRLIETEVHTKAKIQFHSRRTGDARKLSCDSTCLRRLVQDHLDTEIAVGIAKFVRWYRTYFGLEAIDIFPDASADSLTCEEDVQQYA